MNKEELKEEVKTLGMKYGDSYDSYTKSGSQAEAAIRDTLKLIDQLDEPEKVIVPQFVADWIEDNFNTVPYDLYRLYRSEEFQGSHVQEWVAKAQRNSSNFEDAWKYGYEVEKEPLYYMPLPYQDNATIYYYKRDDGKISYKQGGMMKDHSKFTQEELDKYFPEIKHMAIEVSS